MKIATSRLGYRDCRRYAIIAGRFLLCAFYSGRLQGTAVAELPFREGHLPLEEISDS
jgi:hypothetical protein